MRLRYGHSYWLDRANAEFVQNYPAFKGKLEVEVAIVGGGFTGCAAAHAFATAGISVALLERASLGRGSAAASTALLMQEPDRYFSELKAFYGAATARTVWQLSRETVSELRATLRDFDCGLRPTTSLHVATDANNVRDLRRDFKARRSAGFPGRLIGSAALQSMFGMSALAAIISREDAVVDPYRATLALAAAARAAGARIFERSQVTKVVGTRDDVSIRTPGGTLRSRYVVIATGFATPVFKPLQARFRMATTYVIATSPIDPHLRARIGGGGVMFWDARRPYHYFRWTDDGRILFGGRDRPVPRTARGRRTALVENAASLTRDLLDFYPQLGRIRVSHAWEGLFATTPDGLPYIGGHRNYPRHLFALGYGGNGMTFGFLAGQVLVRAYLGRPERTDALFGFGRHRKGRTGA